MPQVLATASGTIPMVFEGIVDAVAELVLLIGIPLLLVLFFLEGIILGKVLQPPAVFVTVIAIAQPDTPYLVLLCLGCTLAVGWGQWTIFQRFDPDTMHVTEREGRWQWVQALPDYVLERIGERQLQLIERLFTRYGGLAVFLSAFIPVVRGTIAVPAGMSSYPGNRFMTATLLANACYFPILTAIAFGILRILGL